jgi:hypothetical protein
LLSFKFNNTKPSLFLDELAAVHHHVGVGLSIGLRRTAEVVILSCSNESEYLEVSIGACCFCALSAFWLVPIQQVILQATHISRHLHILHPATLLLESVKLHTHTLVDIQKLKIPVFADCCSVSSA